MEEQQVSNQGEQMGLAGSTPLEQSTQPSPEELQYQHEKTAFETHIQTSGEVVPDNFENAAAWFDSLKEAQKQYTQTRQELSEVKTQFEQTQQQLQEATTQPPLTNELRIPKTEKVEEPVPEKRQVDEATYHSWSMEFAQKGELSEDTRNQIMEATGFSESMVNDFIGAQKAKLREGYNKAANVVGGQQELDKIFRWASETLDENSLAQINQGLASNNYEITLRGLQSMYKDSAASQPVAAKAAEPVAAPRTLSAGSSPSGITPFENQREFKAYRSDPRYAVEPAFRDIVQKRMALTDWGTLPK